MTDSDQNKQQADSKSGERFELQKIYVKDLSFETPLSPQIFKAKWSPAVDMQMSNTAMEIEKNIYEVTLSVTATAKLEDKTAYLVEINQAGIFLMEGYTDKSVKECLGRICPQILFPYAREAVSDLVIRGGFPPLLLAPINFTTLFNEYMKQNQAQNQDTATAGDTRH